jgi:8-oxo-dGTP pyrophosphatase MutT (NUDIX family)
MPTAEIRVVDVYPYRISGEASPEFLLMRRAKDQLYAGQWRMVGGKIEAEETAWAAARRELVEETGLAPDRFWTIPSLNQFYEWRGDRVTQIPAFAAQVAGTPTLNPEHDAFAWLAAEEAVARLPWPEQQRLLQLAARLLREGIPPSLFIDEAVGDA